MSECAVFLSDPISQPPAQATERDYINDWPTWFAPRSRPFREGFAAGRLWLRGEADMPSTSGGYPLGTVEADAWLAGAGEGLRHVA